MSKVILIRHAESIKNLKKIHGGQGEELTDLGIEQAQSVAKFLKDNRIDLNLKIYASTSFHTRATAQIIAEKLNLPIEKPYEFAPLYLGIADGLSEQQLEDISPETSELFRLWRNKEIDIKKLVVKDMESYQDFWNRGKTLLSTLPTDKDVMMVCSNSLMILLTHIMAGNDPNLTDNYKHFSIPNCGMVTFERIGLDFKLSNSFTNVNIY